MSVSLKKILPLLTAGAFILTTSHAAIPTAPDAAIEAIAKELNDGNGGILWDAMPASYQVDVNAIAQLAGSKIDAEIYDKGFGLVNRLADVASKQKDFILNTQLGGGQSADQIAKLEAAWPAIIGFVKTLTGSSIGTAAGLQSFDGQAFCEQTVSALVDYSKQLAVLTDEPIPLDFGTVKLLESTDTTAVLEMTSPDGSVEIAEVTLVESRWVPSEMASTWTRDLAAAKAQLEAISPSEMAQMKPQIMGAITMFEGVLTQLDAAKTQEQFDQALQGAMMPIMGLMMMQGGMGGGAPMAPTAPVQ
ncbi:hypothetical protein QEH59_02725 [Coraliomargarita sp. SDUM461004]|uniref:Uncharacterized protein n=1 Tax=Thalassobacterium sedimentorum TaxID=3041258 RepID=A0ABU1AGM4_9BACT|nr:hypothetical protein [Coraliomargarita sp. SDUM461004]MDQ8193323.1 hypothetical protein [Coraliomargarita sp. SDUM461004]